MARCAARTSRCSPAAGEFTDDLTVPGQAYGVFVRAQVSHAAIRAVDGAAARAMPGVIGVYTGQDAIADGLGAIPPVAVFPGRDGKPMFAAAMPVLAHDRIRYVGEPVAIVVAETVAQAQDAAEAVRVDVEELPSAPDIDARHCERCARHSRGAAGQCRARLDRRRCGRARRRLRAGRACRARAPRGHAARAGLDGAARRHRFVRPGIRPLHADRQHAGRRGGAQAARRRRVQGATRHAARAHPRCRRRLRHEGAGLSGIRRDPLCGAQMRPAGEVVQQPDGELPFRLGRARRHSGRRARARRQGQVPRLAHARPSSGSAPTRRSMRRSSRP